MKLDLMWRDGEVELGEERRQHQGSVVEAGAE